MQVGENVGTIGRFYRWLCIFQPALTYCRLFVHLPIRTAMQHVRFIFLFLMGVAFSVPTAAQTRFAPSDGFFIGLADAPGHAAVDALVGYRFGAHLDLGLRAEAGSNTYVGPHVGITAFLPSSDWGVHGSGMYRFRVDRSVRSVIGHGAIVEGLLLRRFEQGSVTLMPSAGGYATTADRFESAAGGVHLGLGAVFGVGPAARTLAVEPIYRYSLHGDRGQWGLRLFFNP